MTDDTRYKSAAKRERPRYRTGSIPSKRQDTTADSMDIVASKSSSERKRSILKSASVAFDRDLGNKPYVSFDDCDCPQWIQNKLIRNPYRRLRDPADFLDDSTRDHSKPSVSFRTNQDNSQRKSSSGSISGSRVLSAPSSKSVASALTNAEQQRANIHSITMYMDDHQNPGNTTKLTLAYSSAKLCNASTLSEDMLRFNKTKGRLIQSAVKEVETRLGAHRKKSAQRIDKQEALEKQLRDKKEDIAQSAKTPIAATKIETHRARSETRPTLTKRISSL